ncbi:hypothetical protein L484_025655 [Morus notabilis]|uniref:Uncharacterized protein n=2 Tax=Morus notabilis TaxID=981085 RepID=W9RXM5_9ROSA|nr:hypothetical protein L484_025655 [Morus notabilis]
MGTNYKAALIPQRIRETIHGWKMAARRKRRLGMFTDDSTIHTDASTVISVEEDDHLFISNQETEANAHTEIELQQASPDIADTAAVANETSSRIGTPLLRPCTSVPSSVTLDFHKDSTLRSFSMPARRE